MEELDNFYKKNPIDNSYHKKAFEFNEFNLLTSKINLTEFEELRNQIYWLSCYIYRISFMNYFKSIEENPTTIKRENILIYHPISNIASEICKMFKNDFLYTSILSTLIRQLIEQICIVKEIDEAKIDDKIIVEAAIESHNKHVGAESLNIKDINKSNKGLLKVFKKNVTFGKLASKYRYSFLYNLFSGDLHTPSTIEKLTVRQTKRETYNFVYLSTVLSLLNDVLTLLSDYNTNAIIKCNIINDVDFVEIHD